MPSLSSKEALLQAYEHILDHDEEDATDSDGDGFGFDWDSAECGTPTPTPRDNYATLWMTCNHQETILQDLQDFFRMAAKRLECVLSIQQLVDHGTNNSDGIIQVVKDNKEVLWEGTTHGELYPEANVGRYAQFHATTEEGCEMMVKCVSFSTFGYMTLLFHDRVEIDLTDGRKIISTTGVGRKQDGDISTRFQLQINNKDVARCHLSYRDASNDPSMGPTVERIEVKKDQRGNDLLPMLWFWVHRFIQDNFTTESLSKDAPVSHVMIKATRLSNKVIEQKDGKPLSEKDFFLNYAGFSVRKQLLVPSQTKTIAGTKRPIDEEAVLYIPLLSPNQRRKRMEEGEDFGKKFEWPDRRGARSCASCTRVRLGLLRCRQCGKVHYCNQSCQKKDWKSHRKWCGRTREEVRDELSKLGLINQK